MRKEEFIISPFHIRMMRAAAYRDADYTVVTHRDGDYTEAVYKDAGYKAAVAAGNKAVSHRASSCGAPDARVPSVQLQAPPACSSSVPPCRLIVFPSRKRKYLDNNEVFLLFQH